MLAAAYLFICIFSAFLIQAQHSNFLKQHHQDTPVRAQPQNR